MIEAVLADLDDTADKRFCSVAQQDPVDWEMDIGLHAGGVHEDFIEAQGDFSVKQLARNHGIRGRPRDFMNERGQFAFWKDFLETLQRTFGYRAHAIDKSGMS